jgi:hypothetical protein
MKEIRVQGLKYADRKNLMMRYRDPTTGKQIARSTGASNERKAIQEAAKWEVQLRTGRYQRTSKMPWESFRESFEDATGEDHKIAAVRNYASTLNAFERHCRPARVADMTTLRVTAFATELRKEWQREGDDGETFRLREASVARNLRHVKAIDRWANRQGLLSIVPRFDLPTRATPPR